MNWQKTPYNGLGLAHASEGNYEAAEEFFSEATITLESAGLKGSPFWSYTINNLNFFNKN